MELFHNGKKNKKKKEKTKLSHYTEPKTGSLSWQKSKPDATKKNIRKGLPANPPSHICRRLTKANGSKTHYHPHPTNPFLVRYGFCHCFG